MNHDGSVRRTRIGVKVITAAGTVDLLLCGAVFLNALLNWGFLPLATKWLGLRLKEVKKTGMLMTSNSFASSVDAVRDATDEDVLRKIDAKIQENIRFYATQGSEAISRRIQELEQEKDIERYLALTASSVGLGSVLLSFISGRKWLVVTGVVLGFLLNHSVSGWCPPVPLLRKLGIRTRSEIDKEKYALKILRGDLDDVRGKLEQLKSNPAQDVLRSV